MSATSAPFGFRPAFHPSGNVRPRELAGGLSAAYANNIYSGQPVKFVDTGVINEVSATSDEFVGSFAGVTFTPTGDRPRVSNYWPGGTAFDAGSLTVFFTDDPAIEYEIQTDGTVPFANTLGSGTNFTNLTANNGGGYSQCTATATIIESGTAQMRIINLAPYPNNAWGDAFVILRVLIALHQYTGNKNVL